MQQLQAAGTPGGTAEAPGAQAATCEPHTSYARPRRASDRRAAPMKSIASMGAAACSRSAASAGARARSLRLRCITRSGAGATVPTGRARGGGRGRRISSRDACRTPALRLGLPLGERCLQAGRAMNCLPLVTTCSFGCKDSATPKGGTALRSSALVSLRRASGTKINAYHAPAPEPLTAAGTAELAAAREVAAVKSTGRMATQAPSS